MAVAMVMNNTIWNSNKKRVCEFDLARRYDTLALAPHQVDISLELHWVDQLGIPFVKIQAIVNTNDSFLGAATRCLLSRCTPC